LQMNVLAHECGALQTVLAMKLFLTD
jgi:hypothetical protein